VPERLQFKCFNGCHGASLKGSGWAGVQGIPPCLRKDSQGATPASDRIAQSGCTSLSRLRRGTRLRAVASDRSDFADRLLQSKAVPSDTRRFEHPEPALPFLRRDPGRQRLNVCVRVRDADPLLRYRFASRHALFSSICAANVAPSALCCRESNRNGTRKPAAVHWQNCKKAPRSVLLRRLFFAFSLFIRLSRTGER
jgi:hypothetical protein